MQVIADRLWSFPEVVYLALEFWLHQEPGYFVFVFVSHQLVEIARRWIGESRLARSYLIDEGAIFFCVTPPLIALEFGRALVYDRDRLCRRFPRLENLLHGLRVLVIFPAPKERLQVSRPFHAIQPDRFLNRLGGDGNEPTLISYADQKKIHSQVTAKKTLGNARGIYVDVASLVSAGLNHIYHSSRSVQHGAAANRVAGGNLRCIDHSHGTGRMRAREILRTGGAAQVKTQNQIGIAVPDRGRGFNGVVAENNARHHRPAFLREARLIERDHREAVEPCRCG